MTQYVPNDGVKAIVLGDGEQWYVQCGGYACNRKEAIGILKSLAGDEELISNHFTGEKYGGWCDHGIDNETADFIEKAVPEFTVHRGRLLDSCEAWIVGFIDSKLAILTWDNSD